MDVLIPETDCSANSVKARLGLEIDDGPSHGMEVSTWVAGCPGLSLCPSSSILSRVFVSRLVVSHSLCVQAVTVYCFTVFVSTKTFIFPTASARQWNKTNNLPVPS